MFIYLIYKNNDITEELHVKWEECVPYLEENADVQVRGTWIHWGEVVRLYWCSHQGFCQVLFVACLWFIFLVKLKAISEKIRCVQYWCMHYGWIEPHLHGVTIQLMHNHRSFTNVNQRLLCSHARRASHHAVLMTAEEKKGVYKAKGWAYKATVNCRQPRWSYSCVYCGKIIHVARSL